MMVAHHTITLSSFLLLGAIQCSWAESYRENFINTLLNDFSNTFEGSDYGDAIDYNDMMNQYDAAEMDKGMYKHEQDNQKPSKESGKGHVKGGVLPAYCDPPNPCPKGYTSEDGCIEVDEFENKAEFSRKYQSSQNCMCDSEHMFSCPDPNNFRPIHQEDDISMLGLPDIEDINNPYLSGSKLPIAAKKGLGY